MNETIIFRMVFSMGFPHLFGFQVFTAGCFPVTEMVLKQVVFLGNHWFNVPKALGCARNHEWKATILVHPAPKKGHPQSDKRMGHMIHIYMYRYNLIHILNWSPSGIWLFPRLMTFLYISFVFPKPIRIMEHPPVSVRLYTGVDCKWVMNHMSF